MKKSQNKKRRTMLKKIRRLHLIVSVALFFSYVVLSVSYSPEFFFSDIKNKSSALADDTILITARVLAPPIKPMPSISGTCNAGVFNINLTWPSDENSTSFDIYRNGFPLIVGTLFQSYLDTNTTTDTTYSYIVTARGPMGVGFADSDPVIITSPHICGSNSQTPTVTLAPLSPNDGFYTILDTTRPRFSGTTNIPHGIIDLEIHSTQIIIGQTIANLNGYWTWDPPLDISNGKHILYVTVTDPLDPSRTVSAQLYFIVNFTEENSDKDSSGHKKKRAAQIGLPPSVPSKPSQPIENYGPEEEYVPLPIRYTLTLQNNNIRQGQNLNTIVSFEKIDSNLEGLEAELDYQIYDSKGNLVSTESDGVVLSVGRNIEKPLTIPGYLKEGNYKLKTVLSFNSFIIEREHDFKVTPAPFLSFGGTSFITYPQLLSNLGLLSLLLLLLLLIWIFLFSREYWLSIHALHQITEKHLQKLGLISLKKRIK